MKCPNCNEYEVKPIGKNTYYCRGCFREIEKKLGVYRIFEIDINGNRIKVSTLDFDLVKVNC